MIISEIHEHSVALNLLPPKANIIDIGCRNFLFCNYMRSLGHVVAPVDIDAFHNEVYYRIAITGKDGRVGIHYSNDPQATRIKEGDELLSMRLDTFMNSLGFDFCDLVKIDVEGAEYEIIMSLKKAPAKQLSIEFHLHTGIYGQSEMMIMESKLKSLGYTFAQHELTEAHGAGLNYWSSLFVLR
jgi:hypothetical protein